ncbi:glycerol-3-phosphate 1-O-acyltransferase PlsY [Brevundimonas sp.]|uniref:glycerol-3-phosphate 1-O-acyltransferase PlsY n=1 Tax=Brevundimonas sp. TaxID=1871086 RepID=UPI0025E4835F|nr:glycerol-3-phosphate 1-O-acyltransferase PlsY [Brevundimonas sp.]
MQDLAAAAMLTIGLVAGASYLLGSIPFGVLITRAGGAGDVRAIGSGNIGATNVLRTGRKDLALLTLLADAAKGAIPVLAARWLFPETPLPYIAGGAAFIGHLFPLWLGFKGGKGVATFYGVLFAAAWPVGIVAALAWLANFAVTRISSLSALIAAAAAPIAAWLIGQVPACVVLVILMAALIFVRHHENIGRLIKGQEPRFGAKKDAAS